MPRPHNLIDAIHPPGLPLPRKWEDEFGPYDWTYIAGFEKACAKVTLRNDKASQLKLNAYREKARSDVPADWKTFFVDSHTEKTGWGSLSSKQFKKAFKKKPMRLDKAALIVIALELYAADHAPAEDVWSMISLRPAVFLIDGLNTKLYDMVVRPAMNGGGSFGQDTLQATF